MKHDGRRASDGQIVASLAGRAAAVGWFPVPPPRYLVHRRHPPRRGERADESPDEAPEIERPAHPRHDIRWWSVDDALRIQARTVDWLRTGEGTKGVYVTYHGMYQSSWPDGVDPWQLSAGNATSTADMLADTDLIWCDPPMVDLLATAAKVYPPIPAEPEQLNRRSPRVQAARWHEGGLELPSVLRDSCRPDPLQGPQPKSAVSPTHVRTGTRENDLRMSINGRVSPRPR